MAEVSDDYPICLWQLRQHCKMVEDSVNKIKLSPTNVLALLVYAVRALTACKISGAADFAAMCKTLTTTAATSVKEKKVVHEWEYYANEIVAVWKMVRQAATKFGAEVDRSKDPVVRAIRATPVQYWIRSAPRNIWSGFLGLDARTDKKAQPSQERLLAALDECVAPIVLWWWNLNVLYHGKESASLGDHREPRQNFELRKDIAQRNEFIALVVLAQFVEAAMASEVTGGARPGPVEIEALMDKQEKMAPRELGVDNVASLSPAEQILVFGREYIAWTDTADEPSLDFLHAALQAYPPAVHLHGLFFAPLYRKLGELPPDMDIAFALRHKMSAGMRQGLPAFMSRALANSLLMGKMATNNVLMTADPSGFAQVRSSERRVNFAPFAKVCVSNEDDTMEVEVVTQDPDAILANASSMAVMAPLTAFRMEAEEPEAQLHLWNSDQPLPMGGFLGDTDFHAQATGTMAELLCWLSAAAESMKRQFALNDIITSVFFPAASAKASQLDKLSHQQLVDLHLRLTSEQTAVARAEHYTSPTGYIQEFLTFAAEALEIAAPLEPHRLATLSTRAGKILLQRHMKLTPPKGVAKEPAWILSTTVRDIVQGVCTGQFIDMEPLETAAAFAWVLLYVHAFFFFCRVLPTLHKPLDHRKELLAQLRDLQLIVIDARSALAHKAQYCTVTRCAIEAYVIRMEHEERRAAAMRGTMAEEEEAEEEDEMDAMDGDDGQEEAPNNDDDEMEV